MAQSGDQETVDRTHRIRQIVNDCVVRRAEGEQITDQSLIDAHSDLLPELADELRNLRMIEEAERQANVAATQQSPGLHIRCPHCHNAIEIVEETSLSDVVCPSCGSHLSLVDEPQTFQAGALESIGHFKLLDKLGAGAFGSVWSAKDVELDRTVAIKIPRKGQLSPEDTEQFIREARAAAQLSHPNIIPVHEVGREGERVYIVSEFVHGVNLADWLVERHPTPREAAELCVKLAGALQHAHEHGVIHRDLKPSNIMLDNAGQPHLMDFGLAKREAAEVTMTIEGKLIGTPAYMSPEQAQGKAHEVDPRSDVYSLGVVLFELLTGERPFRGSTQMLIHQVQMEDAPSPRKLNNAIPRDVETICLKCLEKDPNRRYETATALADDLRRFLAGEPVHARPVTQASRFGRLCKRNPVPSTLAAGLIVVLVGGLVGIALLWGRAEQNADVAQASASQARQEAERADREAEDRRRLLYTSDMNLAMQKWEEADVERVQTLLDRHVPQADQEDLRGFEWYHLQHLCLRTKTTPCLWSGGGLRAIAFSPDGQSLASVQPYLLKHWNRVHRPGDRTPAFLFRLVDSLSLAYSPDGKTLAAGNSDGTITKWDTVTDERSFLRGHSGPVTSVTFSSDGKHLVSAGSEDKTVRLWDALTGELESVLSENASPVLAVAISPTDHTVASGGSDGTVKLWDIQTGHEQNTLEGHAGAITSLAYSPDGNTLVSASRDETIKLWRTSSGQLITTLRGHSASVSSVAVSPDGKTLASGSDDKTVKLWDLVSDAELVALKGHASTISSVAFSPDGKSLASAGADETVRLWDMTIKDDPHLLPGNFLGERFLFSVSSDGNTIATPSARGLQLWDVNTGKVQTTLDSGPLSAVAFSDDGKLLATASDLDNDIKLWDVQSREKLTSLVGHTGRVWCLAFSPDGRLLASGSDDASVRLWDVDSAKSRPPLKWHSGRVWTVAWSPDGGLLASGSADSTIMLWDVDRCEQKMPLYGHKGREQIMCVTFSPDGRMLASAATDQAVKLWDVSTGECLETLNGHSGPAHAVVFSPDGATLASGSLDGTVRLWDSTTGKERFTLRGDHRGIHCLAFLSGGHVLAAGSLSGNVRLWRAASKSNVQRKAPLAYHDVYSHAYRLAEHGQWRQATVDLERALDDLRPGTYAWFTVAKRLAVLLVYLGDIDKYHALCRQAVNYCHDTEDEQLAESVAWMCLFPRHTHARSVHQEATRLAERAASRFEQAIGEDRISASSIIFIPKTKGIADYRNGDYASAIDGLETSLANIPDMRSGWFGMIKADVLLFLAMAHHRIDQHAQARHCLTQAIEEIDIFPQEGSNFYALYWPLWIECQVVRQEAEELIGNRTGGNSN